MNNILFPEDIDNVIQSFILTNNGDEITEELILAIGAELLGISIDTMAERICFGLDEDDSTECIDYTGVDFIEPTEIKVDAQCWSCGTPMGSQDNFCPNCGKKVLKEEFYRR